MRRERGPHPGAAVVVQDHVAAAGSEAPLWPRVDLTHGLAHVQLKTALVLTVPLSGKSTH
jgi:hypothetical protein